MIRAVEAILEANSKASHRHSKGVVTLTSGAEGFPETCPECQSNQLNLVLFADIGKKCSYCGFTEI